MKSREVREHECGRPDQSNSQVALASAEGRRAEVSNDGPGVVCGRRR